eukprot:TRINITY_DN19117_c0_g1_i1.p1 TRINITY_DN19117_c0_g1~~TRINITY_DN19117_c0_g1_i1.p1  ORF type:complete len:224 (+),score=42.85 TRINITY_DN19117_c0_g1_i1:206-877(+)
MQRTMARLGLQMVTRVGIFRDAIWSASREPELLLSPYAASAFGSRLSTMFKRQSHVGAGSGGRCGGLPVRNPPDGIPFAIRGLNHIAMVVPDLEEAAEHYRTIFGGQVSAPLAQPGHGVTVVFVYFGNATIELLHPLGENSPVAKFLEKNPQGGVHHLCFTVDDIHAATDHMKDSGIDVLGSGEPKLGAHHNPVIFMHPNDNYGVLYELEQVGVTAREKEKAA